MEIIFSFNLYNQEINIVSGPPTLTPPVDSVLKSKKISHLISILILLHLYISFISGVELKRNIGAVKVDFHSVKTLRKKVDFHSEKTLRKKVELSSTFFAFRLRNNDLANQDAADDARPHY